MGYPGPPGWKLNAELTTLLFKKLDVQVFTNLLQINRANGKATGNWKNALFFGTWNICTCFKTGAAQSVVSEIERYRLSGGSRGN